MRKIQSHQPVMWSHQRLVDLQMCGAAAQGLHIYARLLRIQAECRECAGLTGKLDGINVLVASVVASARIAFGIFVGHGRAQGVENGARCEILRGNEDDRFPLALYFLFLVAVISVITILYQMPRCSYHDFCDFRVRLNQGLLHDLLVGQYCQTTNLSNGVHVRPGETWEEHR